MKYIIIKKLILNLLHFTQTLNMAQPTAKWHRKHFHMIGRTRIMHLGPLKVRTPVNPGAPKSSLSDRKVPEGLHKAPGSQIWSQLSLIGLCGLYS